MHFVEAGRGAPPLLFVHGFACALEDWDAQLAAFKSTHQVVACDLRGHGATPGRAHECSIGHYAADVAALAAHLELKGAILVGHSMGCRVILEAARLDPERIAGLVLVDGSRQASGDPDAAEAAVRGVIEAAGFPAFVETAFRQMTREERIVRRARRLPAPTGTDLWASMVRWDAEHMDAALAALHAPLMVIQSTALDAQRRRVSLQANESSPWLDYVRSSVPGARIEVIPGVGHFPQIEAAAQVNRLIAQFAEGPR